MDTNIYIGVVGERECDEDLWQVAYDVGRRIAENGAIMLCGGMGGIMEAASRGNSDAGGISIGILPGFSRLEANKYIKYSIATGMDEGRNVILVRSCDAIVAVGGGFGTLSEIAFAHRFGIPVVGLMTWEFTKKGEPADRIERFTDPEKAVDRAIELAKGHKR